MIRVSFFLLFIFCSMISQAQLRLDVVGDAKIEGKLNLSAPGNSLFIGTDAGNADDGTDNENVFVGYNAGYYNVDGYYNVFVGLGSGYSNISGRHNTYVGNQAGRSSISSIDNSFFVSLAGFRNTFGSYNVFLGTSSGVSNDYGSNNTFTGNDSGFKNTIGSRNTFNGRASGFNSVEGDDNTFMGFESGYGNTHGSFNIAIGNLSNSLGINFDNSIGVGYDADPDASNVVRIGNANITSIKAKVDITVDSDARFKTQITRDNIPGIEFIKKLSPVTYYYDSKKYADWKYAQYGERDTSMWDSKYDSDKILTTGFIAQEVEEAANSIGYDFSGVDKPASDKATYGLRYSTFVVPLVKAVQEQQVIIEQQQNKIAQLEKEVTRINLQEERISELEAIVQQLLNNNNQPSGGGNQTIYLSKKPSIDQNIPNPFDGTTRINYFIPEANKDKAILVVTGVNGRELQRVKIEGYGEGSVNLKMDRLAKGTYQYSLIVDGKIIDTKRMVYIE